MKLKKNAGQFLEEANAVVPMMSLEDAVSLLEMNKAVVIDVRDGKEIDETGTVKGALCIPRGMMEFVADPSTPFEKKEISVDKEILLICGAGGMAALTGKTLNDMGYSNVHNLGGFTDWKKAGGPVE